MIEKKISTIMKMTNYNKEREHDMCLISLVSALDEAGRLDIFRDAFRIEEDHGPLRWAGRRRAFDVECGRAERGRIGPGYVWV